MNKSFATMFEESQKSLKMFPGAIIKAKVIDINDEVITLYSGLKSESTIPINQFHNDKGELEVSIGDNVEVALDTIEDGWGETRLSREKAKKLQVWVKLIQAYEEKKLVVGTINGRVKGGFTVDVDSIRAFLPGSLVDVKQIRDQVNLEGKQLEFKVIKLDQKRNNIVVSRRSVISDENKVERESLLKSIKEGETIKGIVKNLTEYGAFIDLGGIDGLLHITDMTWKRIKHPNEVVKIGQDITVKILKFDKEKSRVSLGLKQLGKDPWKNITTRYPEKTTLSGKVTNITDYGCFVEIESGVEGLVHVSEMDWTNKNIHPTKVVQLGDEVSVMILNIDEERCRISLGLKQCKPNPWKNFEKQYEKNEEITGKIKSITDFGIFVGLEGGIDGLIHLSDISWNDNAESLIRKYKKSQEIKTIILSIDSERERISLGIKQLKEDPFNLFLSKHSKKSIVSGEIIDIDLKKAKIKLSEGVEAYLKATEFSRNKINDLRDHLKLGEVVKAKFLTIDRKKRIIQLSIKNKEYQEEQETMRKFTKSANTNLVNNTLGDLLKKQMQELEKNNN
jgi:small subunit ribosomal protein S1